MDGHGVESHVDGTGRQADQPALLALEQYQREDVGGREDQGDDGAHESAAGDVAKLALGGALEEGSGRHEGTDEECGEPAGDEDVVDDQCHGGRGQEADKAGAVALEVRDAKGEHQGKDAKVWDQQGQVDAIQLKDNKKKKQFVSSIGLLF